MKQHQVDLFLAEMKDSDEVPVLGKYRDSPNFHYIHKDEYKGISWKYDSLSEAILKLSLSGIEVSEDEADCWREVKTRHYVNDFF